MASLRVEREPEMGKIKDLFPPLIAAQIDYLLRHSQLPIKVDQIYTGTKNSRYADRFSLLIPCCLDYVKWDVVYNCQYPMAAPDIIFGPDDEHFQPLLAIAEGRETSQSICRIFCDWKIRDASGLLQLLLELRHLYMGYQRKRVEDLDDPRLKFEISTIIPRESIHLLREYTRAYFGEVKSKIIALLCVVQCEEKTEERGSIAKRDHRNGMVVWFSHQDRQGVEICLLSGADNLEEVKFAVRLVDLDLSKQVPGCVLRQQQQIFLQVIFPVRKRRPALPSAPHIKLVSSTSLKDLFDVEEMKLPIWVDGMCMAEYIPTLEENLKAQLSEAITSVNLRRAFIEALVPHFGRPLEAETVFCRRVSALAATGPFTFLVHFILPIQFPKQQPTLTFQSSQHFDSQGMPITSRSYSDYPWSPRWDVSQMTQRIYEFVVDECINFKQYCSDALQFHR